MKNNVTRLSFATQAMLNALNEASWDWASMEQASPQTIAAATLRAAADIVAPLSYEDVWTDDRILQYEKDDPVREKLLAIADELESA